MPVELTTATLIAELQRIDPSGTLPIRVWDADADEYVPVYGAIHEEGSTSIDLLTDAEVPDAS